MQGNGANDAADVTEGEQIHLVKMESGFVVDLKQMEYYNADNENMPRRKIQRHKAEVIKR